MTERPQFFNSLCAGDLGQPGSCFMDRAVGLLPSMIYVFNQDTQSNEYANRSVGELMGYNSDEIRGFGSNLMAMLCHPEDLPAVFEHFKRISRLADGEVISVEYRIRHKNDKWIWFLSQDTVFDRHGDGRVSRHLGTATDITSLKVAQQRAVAASNAASIANEDLRAFAYSISHDMKSPTNTLDMLLSELVLVHGQSLEPDASELLGQARQTIESMQRRIERVLDYTRLIDQRRTFCTVDLNEVLRNVLADMAAEITKTQAKIEVDALPMVSGQREELEILFQNLIDNALKFREAGSKPSIRVFDDSDPGESEARIAVSDQGIGIAPDNHDRIFGMFKKMHSEKAFGGTGLGLAICRRVAISHGGDIFVRSDTGQGATFIVHLLDPQHFWRRAVP